MMKLMKDAEPIDMGRVQRGFARAQEQEGLREADKVGAAPMAQIDTAYPFFDLDLDLSAIGAPPGTNGQAVNLPGQELIFLREGSSPGARLTVVNGSNVQDIGPGCRIKGAFKSLFLSPSDRSVLTGRARIRLVTQPGYEYEEPEQVGDCAVEGGKILGDVSQGTFINVAENAQPVGSPAGSFDFTGWRKLRMWINTATFISCDLYPWLATLQTGAVRLWAEQGSAGPISVPDSAATGYQTRVVVIDLVKHALFSGAGATQPTQVRNRRDLMFFEVRNLLPAPLTGIDIAIEGLE